MNRHHFVLTSATLLTIAGMAAGCQTVPASMAIKNGPIALPISTTQQMTKYRGDAPGATTAGANSDSKPRFLNSKTGFIGYNGGVYTTSNGAQSWQRIGQFSGDVASLAFSSATTGLVLIRSGNNTTDAASQQATYTWTLKQTTNGGSSWRTVWTKQKTVAAGSPSFVGGTVIQSDHDAYVLAANHLWVSHDNGQTWSVANLAGAVHAISAPNPGVLYVATATNVPSSSGSNEPQQQVHILKSTDSGRSFHTLFSSNPVDNWQGDFAFHGKAGVFLLKDWGTFESTLYTTVDGGLHWHSTAPQAFQGRVMQQTPVFVSADKVAVGLNPGAAPFAGGIAIVNLTNRQVTSLPQTNWRSAYLTTVGNQLYATVGFMSGESATLQSNDSGRTWTPVFPKPTPSIGIDFVSSRIGFGLSTVGDEHDILRTEDGGSSWRVVKVLGRNVVPENLSFSSDSDGVVLVMDRPNGDGSPPHADEQLLETKDGGQTWSVAAKLDLPNEVSNFIESNPDATTVGLDDSNNRLQLVSAAERLNQIETFSSANGSKWRSEAMLSTPTASLDNYVYGSDAQLWAAVSSTKPGVDQPYHTTLYSYTPKSPKTFTPFWTLPTGWVVLGMARPTTRSAVIYAQKGIDSASQVAFFRTQDGGRHWTEETTSKLLQPLSLWPSGAAVSLSFPTASTGYMLTADGLLKTSDGGITWSWVKHHA